MFVFEWTDACVSFSNQCNVFIVSEFTVFENPILVIFRLNHFPLIALETQTKILVLRERKEKVIHFELKYGMFLLPIFIHLYDLQVF